MSSVVTMPAIIEVNKTIAEFMGYEIIPYQNNKSNLIYNGNKNAQTYGQRKALWGGLDIEFTGRFVEQVKYPFDKEFNLLIPVIERIERMGYVVLIAGIKYQIYKVLDEQKPIISYVCGDLSKKTETTCLLIVAFLKHLKQENS